MTHVLEPTTYRELLRVPYFPRLATASLLARLGGSMWGVALVLFVLERFHSPTLAGITVLLSLAPGLLISPLAGAALDRWGRVPMIAVDYAVGVLTVLAILGLAWAGRLTIPWLLALMVLSSLPVPLGMSGARSLFPILAPRRLWDRANALDAALYSLANIAGPAAAGVVVAIWGGEGALVVISMIWAAATVAILGIKVPAAAARSASVLADAWAGLREVFTNPVLRAITLSVPIQNAARGIFLLAIPVFVLRDLHSGPQAVGWLLSANAAVSLVSGVLAGRMRTQGRERRLMVTATVFSAFSMASLALAPNLTVAVFCMALVGVSSGPFDIPMFSMRQRAVDAALLGRILAVSMSFNFLGNPVGSGIGGPVVAYSPRLGFAVAGVLALAAAGSLGLLLKRPLRPAASRVSSLSDLSAL